MPHAQIEPLESRLLLAGTPLDPTFGREGFVGYGQLTNAPWNRHGVVTLPDNGLILTTTVWNYRYGLSIVRFAPDGEVDGSFGAGGKLNTRMHVPSGSRAALQGQDRLVVLNAAKWRLHRFTLGGQGDATFKSPPVDFPRVKETGLAMIIQPDGRILVAGSAGGFLAITRHTPDGRPDRTFRRDGRLTTKVRMSGELSQTDIALDRAGRILIRTGNQLLRFHPNGRRDIAFDSSAMHQDISAFAIDSDDRIVTASATTIKRYNANGTLDPTFGDGGVLGISLPHAPTALFVQPSGDIQLFSHNGGRWHVGLTATILHLGPDGVGLGSGNAILPNYDPDSRNQIQTVMDPSGRIILSSRVHRELHRFAADPFTQSTHGRSAGSTRFEAEDFDDGGPEVAYHDLDRPHLSTNPRGGYVEIDSSADRTYITNTRPGEWLEYTYSFHSAVESDILFRLSSPEGGGSFHLELDGEDVTGPIAVPRTGGDLPAWADVLSPPVRFPAGQHVLRLVMDAAGPSGNVADFDNFVLSNGLVDTTFGAFGLAAVAPGTILPRPDGATIIVHAADSFTLLDPRGQVIASRPSDNSTAADQALLQPDWKILIRSGSTLRRYSADFTLDLAFADGGALVIDDGPIALLPNGDIIANGASRYSSDGARDESFSVSLADVPLPQREGRHSLGDWQFVGASGRGQLYFAIESRGPGTFIPGLGWLWQQLFYLDIARFHPDGTPDLTYGDNGVSELIVQLPYNHQLRFFGHTVLPDGSVLTGLGLVERGQWDRSGIATVPPDGEPVQQTGAQGGGLLAGAFAALPDGQWVLRGTAGTHTETKPYIIEYHPDLIGGGWRERSWKRIFGDEQIQEIAFQDGGQLLISTNAGLRRAGSIETRPTPFNSRPWSPGDRVDAEQFDTGGEGIGHHDLSPANEGGAYRLSTADIALTGDVFAITHTLPAEWLGYTYRFPVSAAHSIEIAVASAGRGGTFHIEVDGADLTGPIQVPDTGGRDSWQLLTVDGLSIPAGDRQVRLVMDTVGEAGSVGNFDYFRLGSPPAPQSPFHGAPFTVDQIIEAEDYDRGGYGIAFHDNDLTADNAYRNDAVEVIANPEASNGWVVELQPNEWLEYTFRIEESGSYLINIRADGDGFVVAEAEGLFHASLWWNRVVRHDGVAFFASPGIYVLRISSQRGTPPIDSIHLARNPIQLDLTFDSDGVSAELPDQPLAIESGGRIITAQTTGLQRFNPDGAAAPITVEDPIAPLTIPTYAHDDSSIVPATFTELSDGTYLWSPRHDLYERGSVLRRFSAMGTPDLAFANDGALEIDRGTRVAAAPTDGRFYVASATFPYGQMRLNRYTASGQPDPSFGAGGATAQSIDSALPDNRSFWPWQTELAGVAIQRSGRVIVAVLARSEYETYSVIFGFDPSGALDESFGNKGFAVTLVYAVPPDAEGRDPLFLLPDDSMVVHNGDHVLTFTPDGNLQRRQQTGAGGFASVIVPAPADNLLFNITWGQTRRLGRLSPSAGLGELLFIPFPADAEAMSRFTALAFDPDGRLIAIAQAPGRLLYRVFRFDPFALV